MRVFGMNIGVSEVEEDAFDAEKGDSDEPMMAPLARMRALSGGL